MKRGAPAEACSARCCLATKGGPRRWEQPKDRPAPIRRQRASAVADCSECNERWFPYSEVDASPDVSPLLVAIGSHPTGIFGADSGPPWPRAGRGMSRVQRTPSTEGVGDYPIRAESRWGVFRGFESRSSRKESLQINIFCCQRSGTPRSRADVSSAEEAWGHPAGHRADGAPRRLLPAWDSLTETQKKLYARQMEV